MTATSSSPVPTITADELRRRLESDRPVTVIDIRPTAEFAEWHVPGSRNVPAYEALKQGDPGPISDLSFSKGEPVVTVCGAGKTSRAAARLLREEGKIAYSLDGGLRSWSLAWNTAETFFSEAAAQVIQIRRTGKGCLSYLIGSKGEALAVDPSLAPEIYESLAQKQDWDISGVLDTHVHADHLSRARQLAGQTGAALYLPEQDRISYPFRSLQEGDEVSVGSAVVKVLHTPGHTPESMTYQLGSSALFTGDTLFPGGVGRPDLDASEEQASKKARQLYQSLQRLAGLQGDMLVLPGHASRPVPFDGKLIGSSLRQVTRAVRAFEWPESRFVGKITDRLPPAPPNHETVVKCNENGQLPGEQDRMDLEAGANRCAVQ